MLRGFLRTFEDIIYVEKFQSRNGILQAINPEIKLCTTFTLIVIPILLKTIMPLLILLSLAVVLAFLSKIPVKFFLYRSAFFIPFFAAVIALPIPFTTQGTPLVILDVFGLPVQITFEGVLRATQFILRVWVCVSLVALLVLTTRFSDVIYAMDGFKAPKIFVMMTAITYRYIFLFIDEAYRMALAREARKVNLNEPREQTIKSVGKMFTVFFIRAYERGEMVYLAMKARGYSREVRKGSSFKRDWSDFGFLVFSVAVCLAVLLADFVGVGAV